MKKLLLVLAGGLLLVAVAGDDFSFTAGEGGCKCSLGDIQSKLEIGK